MEFLFGERQYGLRILVAVFLVLALIGVLAWLVRVFRSERTGAASRRGRQPPRLAGGRGGVKTVASANAGGRATADIVVEPPRRGSAAPPSQG